MLALRRRRHRHLPFALLVCGVLLPAAQAQADAALLDLPVEDLLAVEVRAAGKRDEQIRDIPASVTILTREEIQRALSVGTAYGRPVALRAQLFFLGFQRFPLSLYMSPLGVQGIRRRLDRRSIFLGFGLVIGRPLAGAQRGRHDERENDSVFHGESKGYSN